MLRHSPVRSSLLLVLLATSAFAAGELSDVVSVPRPEKGEFMGLYLKNQKIGYMFSNVTLAADKKTVTNTGQFIFALDISRFIDSAIFASEVQRHLEELRRSALLPGFDRIRLPGEDRAARKRQGAPGAPGVDDSIVDGHCRRR